jgi:putative ABC transport system permease protein
MSGLIASIVEAYGKLKVGKGRIMLSLIGVGFSVFALTAVLGAGGMLSGALQQQQESWTGRPTVLEVNDFGEGDGSGDTTPQARDDAVLEELDRMGISQRSRQVDVMLGMQTGSGVRDLQISGVDPAYGDMYRLRPEQGRWLADSDQKRLAPALVVNRTAYEQLGRPALGGDPVTLRNGDENGRAVVIGVLPAGDQYDGMAMAYTAAGSLASLPGDPEELQQSVGFRIWVPPESAHDVSSQLNARLAHVAGGSFEVDDAGYMDDADGFDILTKAVAAVAGVILLLGAMGLVNISLVTVRHRVREIGIRRSYGATGLRIFFGVMMESVVATVVAGAVGVALAVALVKAPFTQSFFADMGLVDVPAFPVTAVLTGLGAATAVGILAGALPALIATRIKVIDAIRS